MPVVWQKRRRPTAKKPRNKAKNPSRRGPTPFKGDSIFESQILGKKPRVGDGFAASVKGKTTLGQDLKPLPQFTHPPERI
jgi:hypothetical protein